MLADPWIELSHIVPRAVTGKLMDSITFGDDGLTLEEPEPPVAA